MRKYKFFLADVFHSNGFVDALDKYRFIVISVVLTLIAVCLLSISEVFLKWLGESRHDFPLVPMLPQSILPGEVYYRYLSITMFLVFIIACIYSVFYALHFIHSRFHRRLFWEIVAICLAACLVGSVVLHSNVFVHTERSYTGEKEYSFGLRNPYGKNQCPEISADEPPVYFMVGRGAFCSTIASDTYKDGFVFTLFRIQWDVVDTLAMIASVFLISAAITTHFAPRHFRRPVRSSEPSALLAFYTEQMRALDHFLYLGAAVWVIGIVHLKIILSWPLPFIEEASRPLYSDIVLSFVSIQGVLFALIVAAGFLPLAYGLHRRAHDVASASSDEQALDNRDKWLEDKGWTFGLKQRVVQTLSVLAPFFAAPVIEVLGSLAR